MTLDSFINAYEAALATQDWRAVAPLIHPDACITFSDGTVHEGRAAVQAAFTRNFSCIRGEKYTISNVRWLARGDRFALYLFDFAWSGTIDGQPASGAGRGTAALQRTGPDAPWQLLAEHLGPKAAP